MILPVLPSQKSAGRMPRSMSPRQGHRLGHLDRPATEPFRPGVPRSWWAWMFSPIRMASSARSPVLRCAKSEIMLIETSGNISRAEERDQDARLTQKARRNRRKRASTMNTGKIGDTVADHQVTTAGEMNESSCRFSRAMPSGNRWADSVM